MKAGAMSGGRTVKAVDILRRKIQSIQRRLSVNGLDFLVVKKGFSAYNKKEIKGFSAYIKK